MEKSNRNKRKRACLAKNCSSGSNKNIQLFALPTDKERCNAWYKLLGKPNLINNTLDQPKNGFVCARHFHENDLIKKEHLKLKPDALPFLNLDSSMPTTQTKSLFESVPLKFNPQNVTNTELQCATSFLEFEMKQDNNSNAEIDAEMLDSEKDAQENADANLSPIDKLCNCIKRELEIQGVSSDRFVAQGRLKDIALNLLFSNPDAYSFLQCCLRLPPVQILREAVIKLPSKARIDNNLSQVLRLKLQYMPDEAKYCTLCLTEYYLKKHLSYDVVNDLIIGYHDVNGAKIEKPATVGVVATLRGLLTPWLQPVGFCLLSSKSEYMELDSWIEYISFLSKEIGIQIEAITVPPNEHFYNYIISKKSVSVTDPTCFGNITVLFDAPQLIKRVRNDLLRNDVIVGANEIYFEAVQTLFNFEKSQKLSIVPKLSSVHVNPQRQLVSTKIAAQTLSRSVAAALNFYINSKFIVEAMRPTVAFVQTVNDAFDFINSNVSRSTPETEKLGQAAGPAEADIYMAFLSEMKSKSVTDDFYTDSQKTGEMFCISIQSTKDLKSRFQHGFKPRRLSLETTNRLFVDVRRNKEMTCDKFLSIFHDKCNKRLFNVNKSSEKRETLKDFVKRLNLLPTASLVAFEKSEELGGEMEFLDLELPEVDARVYLAAYLLYMCQAVHSCASFDAHFAKLQLVDSVKHFQNVNQSSWVCRLLRVPHVAFISYVRQLDEVFAEQFDPLSSEPIAQSLMDVLSSSVPLKHQVCECFPGDYLLKLFVRISIRMYVKALNIRLVTND